MKSLRVLLEAFAIFAAVILFVFGLDGIASFKKPVDLYAEDTNVTEIGRTDALEADIYAALDCFATETTTTKRNGATTSTSKDYYYIIPAFDGDDTYYIGVKVPSKNYNSYDKIADLTWAWLAGETSDYGDVTVHAEGCLKKMDDELYGYMVEWFEEAQWFASDAEIDQYVLAVCLEPVSFHSTRIVVLISVVVLILGIAAFVLGIRSDREHNRKVKEQTHVVINGISYPKSTFEHVNRCILNKERVFAVQELRDITGLELEEAQKIINNWNQYYWV